MGAVTPLGRLPGFWEKLKAGVSGVRRIQSFDPTGLEVQIAAEVVDFDPNEFIDSKEARRMGRPAQFAVTAAMDALNDAGLTVADIESISERVAVVFGSSLGGHDLAQQASFNFRSTGRRPGPFSLINSIPNIPAHYISRITGALGPLVCISAACASGTHSIGDGLDLIRHGRAEMVFTGGVETMVFDYSIAGFISMTALATGYNDNPEAASRPSTQTAMVSFSEKAPSPDPRDVGARRQTRARIYAEIPDCVLIRRLPCCRPRAYRTWPCQCDEVGAADAGINPEDVGYINAHGHPPKPTMRLRRTPSRPCSANTRITWQ